MLDPIPRRYHRVLAPVSSTASSAFPTEGCGSASRVSSANNDFSQGMFRGCRYFVMFRPPSSLAPRIVPTAATTPAGQLGLLRPGLSCFVASARTGYANRPKTGNWRYGDLHPARLSALSAAPLPDMPSPKTPRSSDIRKFQNRDVDVGLRQRVSGSALPMFPQSVSRGWNNFEASTVRSFATACQVARRPVRI